MGQISYQGDIGSNSERAAKEFLKKHSKLSSFALHPAISSGNVVKTLLYQESNFGVVAIKNNIGGEVKETKDALSKINYEVIDSLTLVIEHNLCIIKGETEAGIKKIISHPQALAQCSDFLKSRFPQAEIVEYPDTALAARKLADGELDKGSAVICATESVKEYDLQKLYSDMTNLPQSETKFILFKDKTLEKKSLWVRLLNNYRSPFVIQTLLTALGGSAYLAIHFLGVEIYEAVSTAFGLAATCIAFIFSDYAQNYIAYLNIGGYWRYEIKQYDEEISLECAEQEKVRVAQIAFVGGELLVRGWVAGAPKVLLFHSVLTFADAFNSEKGTFVYEYSTSNDSIDGLNFMGHVVLEYFLQDEDSQINKLSGRYVAKGKVSKNEKPDAGQITYIKISKKYFEKLKFDI